MNRKQIEDLSVNEVIFEKLIDKKQVQRIKNFTQAVKKASGNTVDFKVSVKNGTIYVSRIEVREKSGLSEELKAMKSGDVIYPCDYKSRDLLRATARHLGDGYKIDTVMRVEKL